jgi:hypothetical protein
MRFQNTSVGSISNGAHTVLRFAAGFSVLLLLSILSCHKVPDGEVARQYVNADEGATVRTSDGGLILEIPQKALSKNTTVLVTIVTESIPALFRDFMTPLSRCYLVDIGDAVLMDSATVAMTYDSLPSPLASLAYYCDSLNGWVLTGASMDSAAKRVSVKTMHFSPWWLFSIQKPSISYKRLNAPYYDQYGNNWCLPTSMAMMIKNQGIDYEMYEVARDFGFGPQDGDHIYDYLGKTDAVYDHVLSYHPSRLFLFGLDASFLKPIIGNLVEHDRISLNGSSQQSHAVVATGYSNDSVYINDPSDYYQFGPIGAASWDDFINKVGYIINVIEAFEQPPSPENARIGSVEIGSLVIDGTNTFLMIDGRYPCGYYYVDNAGRLQNDPNTDGLGLQKMPSTENSIWFKCEIANPTNAPATYHLVTKIRNRRTGSVVSTINEQDIAVPSRLRLFASMFSATAPYHLSALSPDRYSLVVSMQTDGVTQDSFVIHFNLAAAAGSGWTRVFGGANYDEGHSVQQTSDGGYIIAGTTASYGAGNYDVWLIKTDANGNKTWDKTFGGANDDYGSSVQQTSDGGYIITGRTELYGAGCGDVWLIKTDADGNTAEIPRHGPGLLESGSHRALWPESHYDHRNPGRIGGGR